MPPIDSRGAFTCNLPGGGGGGVAMVITCGATLCAGSRCVPWSRGRRHQFNTIDLMPMSRLSSVCVRFGFQFIGIRLASEYRTRSAEATASFIAIPVIVVTQANQIDGGSGSRIFLLHDAVACAWPAVMHGLGQHVVVFQIVFLADADDGATHFLSPPTSLLDSLRGFAFCDGFALMATHLRVVEGRVVVECLERRLGVEASWDHPRVRFIELKLIAVG